MKRATLAMFLVCLPLAAVLTGCTPPPLGGASRQMFLDAHQSFERGDYRQAEAGFSEVIQKNPHSGALSELHYFRGLSRLKLNRRSEAKGDFQKGASSYGRELTQVYSAVALANLEYEEGHDQVAVHLYTQVLDHPVKDLQLDAMLYRLGVSLQRLGRWEEADRRLAQLISDYRGSPLIPAARQRFRATHFAIQVGAFADRRNAELLAARVRREGYPVALTISEGGGKTLHAVTLGHFRTWSEVTAVAERLRRNGYSILIKP